jgi:hypothetical protein
VEPLEHLTAGNLGNAIHQYIIGKMLLEISKHVVKDVLIVLEIRRRR